MISPITAVRPKLWIAWLSAVTRVAYPMMVVTEQSATAPPEEDSASSTLQVCRYRW